MSNIHIHDGRQHMKASRRGWVTSLTVAALMATGVPGGVEAYAATSCYGMSCTGKNPNTSVCASDARTIMSRHVVIRENYSILELRYSPRCFSNWVRFTPWQGSRSMLANLLAKASLVSGRPWIWRKGVAHSLQGYGGSSAAVSYAQTVWSKMVTASGTTCTSVEVYQKQSSSSGQGGYDELGTFNAPCVS